MPGLVRDLMTVRVVTVRFDEPISVAVDRLTRFGFSALPVVSGSSRLVGMVSLLDVLRYREAHPIPDDMWAGGVPADERVPVEEIMNPDVFSMAATANADVVAQRLRSHGELRVLPIVQGGKLVGVVTRSDLLRRREQGNRRAGIRRLFAGRNRDKADDDALFALARHRRTGLAPAAATPVRDVMTRQAITIRSAEPVTVAAGLMLEHRHTSLPVVDGQSRLVGIVSEADILALPETGRSAPATVQRVMTTTPIVVDAGATVGEARALVADRGLRTVPVTEGDRLVGVLGRSDLV
jgi:CBS domain-containing protein